MDDLISRQAAIDAKQEFRNPNVVRSTEARTAYDRTYAKGWNDCNSAWIDVVKDLPSAQPEIIRCKDCKWYGRADKRRFYRGTDCLNHRIDTIVPDKDYCSRAERRTDERFNQPTGGD